MSSARRFLDLTVEAASSSVLEFFRPLLAIPHLLKSPVTSALIVEPTHEDQVSLEEAKAILREGLARGRHQERFLLTQCIIAALASVLALAISLLDAFRINGAVILAIILPISGFAVWVAFRVVKNRERIIELKTVYGLMKSVDRDTAERVVKQVMWGKRRGKRVSKKGKNPR